MNSVKAVFGVGLLALAIWMLERIIPGRHGHHGALGLAGYSLLQSTSVRWSGIPEGRPARLEEALESPRCGVLLVLAGATPD